MTKRSNEDRLGAPIPAPEPTSSQTSSPGHATPPTLSFITPTEFVELPSKGAFYLSGHPLHNQEVIEIKHMTTKEEDILTSTTLLRSGLAIDRMLESIIINKDIKVDDLLLGDKNALVVAARAHGYGTEYQTNIVCPACEEQQQYSFDLDSLKVHRPTKEFFSEHKVTPTENNTFNISLPRMEYVVEVRLLTGHDEKYMNRVNEHKKKRNLMESPVTDFLRAILVSVNGVNDESTLNGFINSLPAYSARYIRTIYNKLIPTLDLSHDFKCGSCTHTGVVEVPLTADFFWFNPQLH